MRTYHRKVCKKRRKQTIGKNKYDYSIFQIWQLMCTVIAEEVDKISFNTWFKEASPLTLANNLLIIRVPNRIIKETLDRYYISIIKQAARSIGYYTLKFAIVAVEN